MRGVAIVWILLIAFASVSALDLNDITVPSETLIVTGDASTVSGPFRAPVRIDRPVISLIEITGPDGETRYVTYRESPITIANSTITSETIEEGFSWEITYELSSESSYDSIDVMLEIPSNRSVSALGLLRVNASEAVVNTRVPGSVTITGISDTKPGGSMETFTYGDLLIEANESFTVERLEGGVSLRFSNAPVEVALSEDAYVRVTSASLTNVLPPVTGPILVEDADARIDIYPFVNATLSSRALDLLPIGSEDVIDVRIVDRPGPVEIAQGAELILLLNRNTGTIHSYDAETGVSIEDQGPYDENTLIGAVHAIVISGNEPASVIEQGPARVGEPVRWTVPQSSGRVRVPANAYDLTLSAFDVSIGSSIIDATSFERLQELRRLEQEYLRETRTSRDYLFREGAQQRVSDLRTRITELQESLPQVPAIAGDGTITVRSDAAPFEFLTPGPQMRTTFKTEREVEVLVTSETHLTDVEVTASVPSMDASRVAVLWVSNASQRVPIKAMRDVDGDGGIDEVVFVAPHLSDQLFRIIELTYAEELDADGVFLRDITSLVIEQDGESAFIKDGHTVRATFESEIDYRGEMIVVANGSSTIDIREAGSSETIATIGPIDEYGVYRTRLLEYLGSSTRFDFVAQGDVSIDFIIDPSAVSFYDPSNSVAATWTCTGADCGIGNYAVLDDGLRRPTAPSTATDYLSTGANSGTIEEIGFPAITQANIDYITLWTYTATGANHQIGVAIENNGAVQATGTIAPGSSAAWRFVNWTSPGTPGTVTATYTPTKNGPAGPTTGFLYAAYLEVGYTDNTAPTITYIAPTTVSGTNTSTPTIEVSVSATDTGGALDDITIRLYNATSGALLDSDISTVSPLSASYTPLTDGDYAFNATATDVATNTNSTETRFVTIDTIAPQITLVAPSETNDSFVARSWLAFNVTVIERNLDTIVFNLTNATDGSLIAQQTSSTSPFFFNFTGLADDHYNFTAYVNDSAGNTNQTELVHVNIDTTPPQAAYVAPTEIQGALLDRSNIQVNVTSFESNPESLDRIRIELRTRPAGSLVNSSTSSTGASELFANFTHADGRYVFNASASNRAGLTTQLESRNVTIDTTPPTLTITSPLNNTQYLNETVLVQLTTSDATTTVDTVGYFNGTANVSYTGAVNLTLADANYAFIFYANDSAGNRIEKLINFTVNTTASDTDPPELFIFSPIETTYNTSSVLVNFTANDNVEVDTISYDNGTGLRIYTSPESVTLSDGDYTFVFFANDTSNNTVNESRSFTIDTIAPQINYIAVTTPDGEVSMNTYVDVAVSASDANLNLISIDLYDDGGVLLDSRTSATSPFAANFTALADGVYFFNATATDDAGNTNATQTRSVIVDTTAPSANYVSRTTLGDVNLSQSYIEVNVTASDANLAEVRIDLYNASNGALVSSQNSSVGFFYNFTSLVDGDYAFNATIVDDAGLVTTLPTRIVTLDTTAPSASYVSPSEPDNSRLSRDNIAVNVTATDLHLDTIEIELTNSTGVYSIQTSQTSPFFFNFTALPDGQYFYKASVNDSAGNEIVLETRAIEVLANPTLTFSGYYDPTADIQTGWTCIGTSCVNGQWDALNDGDREPDSADVNDFIRTTAGSGLVSEHSIDPIVETEIETIRLWAYVQTGSNFQMTITIENNGAPVASTTVPTGTSTGWVQVIWNSPGTPGTVSGVFTTTKVGGGGAANGDVYAWYVEVQHNDTTAPTIEFVAPTETNGTIFSGGIEVNVTANDTESGLSNITTNLYDAGGTLVDSDLSIVSPKFHTFNVADGLYRFNATAFDLAGNANTSETREVTVDNTAPSISFVAPTLTSGSYSNRSYIEANVSASDALAGLDNVTVSLYNATNNAFIASQSSTAGLLANFTALVDGIYLVNATANDTVGNTNATETRTITIDTITPLLDIQQPVNGSEITSLSFTLNYTASDTNLDTCSYSLDAGAYTPLAGCTNVSLGPLAEGPHTIDVRVNDSATNTNLTRTAFTINLTKLSISDIIIEPAELIEGDSVTLRVNVTNAGPSVENVTVDLNISLWNGTWVLEEQLSGNVSVGRGSWALVNFTTSAQVGTRELSAYVDPADLVEEDTNADNAYLENLTVSSWNIFHGLADNIATILSGSVTSFYDWNVGDPEGVIMYADADASFFVWNLEPLNGTSDFTEADTALGSTYYEDSVRRLFDADSNGVADRAETFIIGSRDVANVPVTNTTAADAFVTGLLWDSADGGSEYDGTQDLIVITRFNASQVGTYGTYDYEIRVPVGLETLISGTDQVQRIFDLR